ncbi:F-box and WD-40 domain protein 7 [Nematocida homosporus]|uniref:F-box and WD-40 domain protein 7 n=1 Tax=Nematocida homosporus TaxID=1912981 RepID=UPI00222106CC|nr:F-box and WD-40 domain protein 7 [Nematocida homosporus]KAI5184346.1 F-box and WD-40 domain protein 7 [Nematocida homosporus]
MHRKERVRVFPAHALEWVAKHLTLKELKKVMCVSEEVKRAIEGNPVIWMRYLQGEEVLRTPKYLERVKQEHLLSQRWRDKKEEYKGRVKHPLPVEITKLKMFGDILIVSSNSALISVFDIKLNLLARLSGHKGSIWAFDYRAGLLLTGSTDRTAKVWDCFLGVCIRTLVGHTSTIRCVLWADEYVITGSRDSTLRVWAVRTGQCLRVLSGHRDSIRDVKRVEGKPLVVSGSYDGSCILWNYETGAGLRYLLSMPRRLYSVLVFGSYVCLGGMDQVLNVVDLEGKVVFRSKGQTGTIFKIRKDRFNVYALTTDGSLSKWVEGTSSLAYLIETATKAIDFVVLNHYLVIGLLDRVDLYCKETGKYARTICVVEQLYALWANEEMLFYSARSKGTTEIYTVHYVAKRST